MSIFDDFSTRCGDWLTGTGPMSDIVISSRIRLARNLSEFPFFTKADDGQRREVYRLLFDKISSSELGSRVVFVDMDEHRAAHRA